MEQVKAPWTASQTKSLNGYQARGYMHPFTCPKEHPGQTSLVALDDGWHCPRHGCDYVQDWAHDFMADWTWLHLDPLPNWLEVREAARRLGVHENTIRNWCESGLLRYRLLPHSNYRRIAASSVEYHLNTMEK